MTLNYTCAERSVIEWFSFSSELGSPLPTPLHHPKTNTKANQTHKQTNIHILKSNKVVTVLGALYSSSLCSGFKMLPCGSSRNLACRKHWKYWPYVLFFSGALVPSLRLGRSLALTDYPNPRPLMTVGTSILHQMVEKNKYYNCSLQFSVLA